MHFIANFHFRRAFRRSIVDKYAPLLARHLRDIAPFD
jgi:hypothetical protein